MQIGFIKQILKRPADFLILTYRQFETSFVIHGYVSLSGLNSFMIVQNFPNSAHPNIYTVPCGVGRKVDVFVAVLPRLLSK